MKYKEENAGIEKLKEKAARKVPNSRQLNIDKPPLYLNLAVPLS